MSVPYKEIKVDSPLQIVAARVHLNADLIVSSIYLPPSGSVELNELNAAISQLLRPVLIMGDFNGHHTMWGFTFNSARGKLIETCIKENNFNILNDFPYKNQPQLTECSRFLHLFSISSDGRSMERATNSTR